MPAKRLEIGKNEDIAMDLMHHVIQSAGKFYISKRTWFDKGIVSAIIFIFVVLLVVALFLLITNFYELTI